VISVAAAVADIRNVWRWCGDAVETEKRFTNPPASDTTQQTSRYPEAELYVVPEPSISMVTIAGIAVSALTLAILTAIVPGWQEGRQGKPRVRRVWLRAC
jgi:hypothetical protein